MNGIVKLDDFLNDFSYPDSTHWNYESMKAEYETMLSSEHAGRDWFDYGMSVIKADMEQLDFCIKHGELDEVMSVALFLGARWSALKSQVERPRKGGRKQNPEWPYIREEYLKNPTAKVDHIVKKGLDEYARATGKQLPQGKQADKYQSVFEKRFSEMVKLKAPRKRITR